MTMDAAIHRILPPPAIYDHAYKGKLTALQWLACQPPAISSWVRSCCRTKLANNKNY
jgi:hypothetical protein